MRTVISQQSRERNTPGHKAPVLDSERAAAAEALASFSSLTNKVAAALNPELLEFEKTRAALLRLAATRGDRDAIQVLFKEHQRLIETSIHHHFGFITRDKLLPVLLDRIALRARYYDPDTSPEVWLQDCVHLECKRLKFEIDPGGKRDGR